MEAAFASRSGGGVGSVGIMGSSEKDIGFLVWNDLPSQSGSDIQNLFEKTRFMDTLFVTWWI
jgi:hypothetical protein